MKIISLNTWSGRAGNEILLDFFRRNKDIDIFCLQEMWEGGHEHAPKWGENIDTTLITNVSNILKGHSVHILEDGYLWLNTHLDRPYLPVGKFHVRLCVLH